MRKIIWWTCFAATAIVAGVMIYEDLTLDSGILGGGMRYSFTLVIGSPPGPRYGIERESCWIDPAGEIVVPYLESIPPGYKHHVCANMVVGDLSIPLPFRPWADATLVFLAVGAFGWFCGVHGARPRAQAHEAPVTS